MLNLAPFNPSISFMLGQSCYEARPLPGHPECSSRLRQPSLITCFQVSKNSAINSRVLHLWRKVHLDQDDVFHPNFLQNVIFCGVEQSHINLTDDAKSLLGEWGTVTVEYESKIGVASGPYLVHLGTLHSVWKVYEDRQLAFSQSIWPSDHDNQAFVATNAPGNGYRGHGIAVPARSYAAAFQLETPTTTSPNTSSPLRGMRFTVKDNYHVRGIRTALGNRAFFETYYPQDSNATVVTKLLDAGAHLVGKTHLSSFAMMEHPTQSTDYQAPFNPRGDGYLIPGGSSSGSASSAASYDWLDIALCSDTTGSSRIPAFQMGLFGFRPTINSIPDGGLVMAWPGFDTPAWMGRDLNMFPHVFRALSDADLINSGNVASPTPCILYPTDFIPSDSQEQVNAMEEFLDSLGKSMGVKSKTISIHHDWSKTAPVAEKNLHQYLHELTHHGWFYSANHAFKSFRHEYEEMHGKPPFVTEVVRWYWELGSNVSEHQHQEIMNRLSIFKDWFVKQYMADGTNIVALHIDKVQARYRDIYPGGNNPNVPGLRSPYLSAILGAPELAIPISELPYTSRISKKEEKLPIVVSLMGAPGCDLRLLQWTFEGLEKSGRPTKVKTGKSIF
ncbi:amidase signature domain-containing protein [Nemania sp. FL0031]|nr:amidase signature domain-containing protein [Nemania sp. FL0031]